MLLSLKEKSILMPATATWMNLEAITLSGISQSEKGRQRDSTRVRPLGRSDSETGGGVVGARGWERGKGNHY